MCFGVSWPNGYYNPYWGCTEFRAVADSSSWPQIAAQSGYDYDFSGYPYFSNITGGSSFWLGGPYGSCWSTPNNTYCNWNGPLGGMCYMGIHIPYIDPNMFTGLQFYPGPSDNSAGGGAVEDSAPARRKKAYQPEEEGEGGKETKKAEEAANVTGEPKKAKPKSTTLIGKAYADSYAKKKKVNLNDLGLDKTDFSKLKNKDIGKLIDGKIFEKAKEKLTGKDKNYTDDDVRFILENGMDIEKISKLTKKELIDELVKEFGFNPGKLEDLLKYLPNKDASVFDLDKPLNSMVQALAIAKANKEKDAASTEESKKEEIKK